MNMNEENYTDEQLAILYKENQHFLELQGLAGLDPYVGYNSAPRTQMFSNNLGQWITIDHPTERLHQTGAERDHAQYVFNVVAPCNMDIIAVINRQPRTRDEDTVKENPETIILYENKDPNSLELGIMSIVNYKALHSTFGFKYRPGPAYHRIGPKNTISKGEVFLEPYTIMPKGGYGMGRELNVAHMSLPGVAEDGIVVSETTLRLLGYKTITTRQAEFGANLYPLNLYPKPNGEYGICPEIGEFVRPDGLLLGLRAFNENTAAYDQSAHGLKEFQAGFDQGIYVPPNGKVIDIKVIHDPESRQARTPMGMDIQLRKYSTNTINFYRRILTEYYRMLKLRGKNLRISNELRPVLRMALYITNNLKGGPRIPSELKKARLNDWYVEYTVEHSYASAIGSKLTGTNGDKGVIVQVLPDDYMPVDDFGNRADIVVSAKSSVNRAIMGRVFEPKMNAVYRDICVRIIEKHKLDKTKISPAYLDIKLNEDDIESIWSFLVGFYNIYSPQAVGPFFKEIGNKKQRLDHIAEVLSGDRILYLPPDNEPPMIDVVKQLNEYAPNFISPVTYKDVTGQVRRTVGNVLISSAYHLLLDKVGNDWAAVNSSRLQHYGLLARITNNTKYSSIVRHQPPKITGESEVRLIVSYTTPMVTAELADRNNNRQTMEKMVEMFLTHPTPTNIDVLIDREEIPYGKTRPLEIVNHVAETYGWRFKYFPYVQTEKPTK